MLPTVSVALAVSANGPVIATTDEADGGETVTSQAWFGDDLLFADDVFTSPTYTVDGERYTSVELRFADGTAATFDDGYGGTTSSLGGWHVALNPNSSKRDQALQVMEAMTEPEMQLFLL